MRLVLVGPPGSGKGTQAEKLCERLGLAYIGTGNMFREAIKQNTAVGQVAKPLIDQGLLVPDLVVNDLVASHQGELKLSRAARGGAQVDIVLSAT